MEPVLKINPNDNVVVALRDIAQGETVSIGGKALRVSEDITRGHKIALRAIKKGENVVKYGFPIGHAVADIPAGAHVHTQNLKTNLSGPGKYTYEQHLSQRPAEKSDRTFRGYVRKNGNVGIRNELWIVPTVGCVNSMAERMVDRFRRNTETIYADNINILTHNFGCSQLGDDFASTRDALLSAVHHPNAGGVLVLSLGCENNTPESFRKALGPVDEDRIKFLTVQECGDEIEEGAKLLAEINLAMKDDRRTQAPLSRLRIGLKCGGSDGLSGITANPLIGRIADFVTGQGGTAVLSEVPEMFGAETLLMERARSREVFDRIVAMVNGFKDYFLKNGQTVAENPSPGNKAGGITTLEDKALGCTQKAGSAAVEDVLRYGETIRKRGLNLLCAPGNDMVSVTALAVSGCQMVLFSTGRGTPFGGIVPTVKISTNSPLAKLKPHWIDFDAGAVVTGTSQDTLAAGLTEKVLAVAGGELTNNEKNGFRGFSIWKNGVTL